MHHLIRGIHAFRAGYFATNRPLFQRLADDGQDPVAALLTCADSRVVPSLMTDTAPGELFVVRNAGNIVPPHEPGTTGGEAASLEYAVEVLGVRDVIVCGHTGCGAIAAVLDPESARDTELVGGWVDHAARTREIIAADYATLAGDERLTAAVEENVLVQLEHLRGYPFIERRLGQEDFALHGWVYDLSTGEVFAYDPASEDFLPMAETADAH